MEWIQVLTIIGSLGGFGAWIWSRLDKRFDKIDQRFDKVENEIKELRTSLNRMEGAFYGKECCMLKNDENEQKKTG